MPSRNRRHPGHLRWPQTLTCQPLLQRSDWGTDELGRSNHERVTAVNKALTRAGLVTWFDEERMRGDVVAQMTDGIDKSSLVLVFITKNYIRKVAGLGPKGANDNCKVRHRHGPYTCRHFECISTALAR